VREVNRTILLSLIRRHQPLSRAELGRRTGISPSNISRIVEGLVEEGLLTEERAVPVGRGKVPMLLRLRDEYFEVLGIYVQPALTRIAYAGFSGEVRQSWSLPTPADPREFVRAVAAELERLTSQPGARPIRAIGVGVPGFVDAGAGRVTCVTSMPGFSGFPLASELQQATSIPTLIDNDCNLGALSELRRLESRPEGAGGDFLFLSVGDHGVGAGLVLNGEVYRGHNSTFAAEVGHMIVHPGGLPCGCGRSGCLETYVSNEATWRRYRPRTPFTRERFRAMLRAAADGDARAAAAIDETARYLSLAAANVASVLNPSEIVLAGEITEAFSVISETMHRLYGTPYAEVRIRRSWFPREAPLLHGAVCLALGRAVSAPVFGQPVAPHFPLESFHA
jgi:predicted NBD/HSP70 family sugar kinase